MRALHRRGHEIGCHTFSHVQCRDAQRCREWTPSAGATRPPCMRSAATSRSAISAYPFGRLTLSRKLQLQRRFDTCRGVYEGINAGTVDLGLLRVIELYDRTLTAEKIRRVLAETRSRQRLADLLHPRRRRPAELDRLLAGASSARRRDGAVCGIRVPPDAGRAASQRLCADGGRSRRSIRFAARRFSLIPAVPVQMNGTIARRQRSTERRLPKFS